MIALLAALTAPILMTVDVPVTFARDLVSVNHVCNTLTLQGAPAYAVGSRGYSVYVSSRDPALAERILEQDRKQFPFHHGRMIEREVMEPVRGEALVHLDVDRGSLGRLERNPLLRTLITYCLDWAEGGKGAVKAAFAMEAFISKADFRRGDGSIEKAYFGRVIMGDRNDSNHFGYVELFVPSAIPSEPKHVEFGVWGETTLQVLASASDY